MDPSEVLRIVDAIHRDKKIDKEIVFEGIEAALVSAAKKHYGEDEDVTFNIDRHSGVISGIHNGAAMTPEEMAERIGAQTAKQVMIQKIREAERDAIFGEYDDLKGQLVTGVVHRYDGGPATIQLQDGAEALLPRSEQIPGETYHVSERLRCTVYEVRKKGSRVQIILSRTKAHLVQRLFEQEIPEIADGVIEIRAAAREPGYRTKVAVTSSDQRVDSVGACVGVRGTRIKNIVEELAGERIDIVRWSDDMQVLIPNALQPAEVEEVILCPMLGRAIVLVREDQLSLAIGRRGQNVRLASKLCGWDIEIMTRDELGQEIEQAVMGFSEIEGIEPELADRLVGEGFLTYDDLSVIEPDALTEMGELSAEQVDRIVEQAEARALEAERFAAEQRRRQREQERRDVEAAAAAEAARANGESLDTPPGVAEEAAEETTAESAPADATAAETSSAEGPAAEDPPRDSALADEESVAQAAEAAEESIESDEAADIESHRENETA